jgi:hypothetical protein
MGERIRFQAGLEAAKPSETLRSEYRPTLLFFKADRLPLYYWARLVHNADLVKMD